MPKCEVIFARALSISGHLLYFAAKTHKKSGAPTVGKTCENRVSISISPFAAANVITAGSIP